MKLYFLSRVLSPSLLCPRLALPLPSFTHSCLPLALAYRPPSVFTSALRSLSCRQTQTILLSSPHVPLGYPTPTFLFISPLPTANIPVGSPRLPPIQSTDCSPLTLPRTTIPSSTWTLIQNLRKRLLVHRQSKCISILPSYTFPTWPRRPFVSLANLFLIRSSLPSEALEEFLSILRPSLFPPRSPILRPLRYPVSSLHDRTLTLPSKPLGGIDNLTVLPRDDSRTPVKQSGASLSSRAPQLCENEENDVRPETPTRFFSSGPLGMPFASSPHLPHSFRP